MILYPSLLILITRLSLQLHHSQAAGLLAGSQTMSAVLGVATDTIRVTRLLHLGQVASTLDIPIETLRTLNPQYKMDIIPATIKSYTLVLPQHYLCQYIASEEEIHRKDSTYLKEYINPANIEKKKLADTTPAYTTYTVKRGDTLGAIARRYRTTTAQIMKLNISINWYFHPNFCTYSVSNIL